MGILNKIAKSIVYHCTGKTAYYVHLDDKICVLDTVDKNFKEEWLDTLRKC